MAQAKGLIRTALTSLTGGVSAAVLLFALTAWVGSSLPRNGDWTEPPADNPGVISIMIEDNGVHTAIVMPLVTPQKDWRADFPNYDLADPYRDYTHVSVSWGEREVFLNTPTWSDITPTTMLRAAVGGDGLLHVAHYVLPAPGEHARVLRLRPDEYARLVRRVEAAVPRAADRETYAGYAGYDVFYDAPGGYHIGNTCNQWTSDTLAAAGVKTGRWTPFAGGVMKWVAPPPRLDNSVG